MPSFLTIHNPWQKYLKSESDSSLDLKIQQSHSPTVWSQQHIISYNAILPT